MVDVITEITIGAPLEKVAAFSADPSNVSRCYKNISSVEWLMPKPVRLGSKVAFVAHLLGRTLGYTYEIVEFVEGERW